jgi:hypothetical protein
MADLKLSTVIDLDLSDDDVYKPSTKEQSSISRKINMLNYINTDHPLLPLRRVRSANSMIELRSRIRHYTAFWWNVLLVMQEDKNLYHYRALQAKLTKMQQENERLKEGISKIRQQSTKDKATIDYLSRATPPT